MTETPLVTPLNPNTLTPNSRPVVRQAAEPPKSPARFYVWFLLIILAGVLTGYLFSRGNSSTKSGVVAEGKDIILTDNEVGSTDTKTFRDTAKGTLEIGGSNGEGTHKLIRTGGASQTVYLVSSVIDLDQYAGKQVEIWGETLKAKKVGWLMDVGRLKIVE